MAKSSIYGLSSAGEDPPAADALGLAVGSRIRDRRRALGMTQAQLAAPYTKSYVSAVECGKVLPSLRSLWILAVRLGVDMGELLDPVKGPLTCEYNPGHGRARGHRQPDTTAGRRRSS